MIGDGGHARHLIAEGCQPDLAVVAIGDPRERKKEAEAVGGPWANFTSAKAMIYTLRVGAGCMFMAGAIVHGVIGDHVIVGNNATVSHDCTVGDFVTIGPGAVICGGAQIGDGCFIGANAVVTPEAVVPANTLVKAGERWSKRS